MKVVAVMPAYNAARTLEPTIRDIPVGSVDEIILGDDGSTDATVRIAESLGLIVVRHETNRGYGANQKSCYTLALERGADIVVMLHPDYQYDSRLIPYFTGLIREGYLDVVLGSRIRTRREALAGGMPPYKYVANRLLTFTQNIFTGMNLCEWHTGFRAFSRKVLEAVRWEENSNDFVFDSQILLQCVACSFRVGEIPVPVRYHDTSSSISFTRSLAYGVLTLLALGGYLLHRAGILRSRSLLPKSVPLVPSGKP